MFLVSPQWHVSECQWYGVFCFFFFTTSISAAAAEIIPNLKKNNLSFLYLNVETSHPCWIYGWRYGRLESIIGVCFYSCWFYCILTFHLLSLSFIRDELLRNGHKVLFALFKNINNFTSDFLMTSSSFSLVRLDLHSFWIQTCRGNLKCTIIYSPQTGKSLYSLNQYNFSFAEAVDDSILCRFSQRLTVVFWGTFLEIKQFPQKSRSCIKGITSFKIIFDLFIEISDPLCPVNRAQFLNSD